MKYTSVPAASSTEFERSPLGSFRKVFFCVVSVAVDPLSIPFFILPATIFLQSNAFFFPLLPSIFWGLGRKLGRPIKSQGKRIQKPVNGSSLLVSIFIPALSLRICFFFFGSSISNALSIGSTKINGNDMPAGIECMSPPSERLTLS